MKKTGNTLLVLAVLAMVFSGWFCGRDNDEDKTPPGEGIVTYVIGSVNITGGDGKSAPAQLLSRIGEKDIIRTGNKSSATVQLSGLGIVRILENSTASFGKILRKDGTTSVKLEQGRVFSKITRKGPVHYRVETPTITASVRGTEFLTIAGRTASSVWVRKGKVGITGEVKKETLITADRTGNITKDRWVSVSRLDKIQQLQMEKLSLHPYVEEIEKKDEKQVKKSFAMVPARERVIEEKIEQIVVEIKEQKEKEEIMKLPPLDRLRREGKPLTRVFTKDGSQLVGTVEKLTDDSIILNTGEGEIEIPKNDIRRRVPEQ